MTTLTSLITKREALDTHNNLRLKETNFSENFPGNISTQFSIIVQTFHEILCLEMSCFGKLFITMFNSIINKLFCSKLTYVLGKIKESNYPCNVHTLVTCTYNVSLNSVPHLKGDYSV